MKIISLFLLSLFLVTNSIQAQNSIQASIDRFANDAAMNHASISFKVIDLSSGQTVASHNPDLTMPTASTAKLFSTATAIDILGPNYRPVTKVYSDGDLDSNGVLHGAIWIRGGGDPALGSKYFNDENSQVKFLDDWAKKLSAKGIKRIEGTVIADASSFGYHGVPDGWNWVDLGNYYGAGPSGLTIYDNLVRFYFSVSSSANRLTKIRSIEPEVPGLIYHNYVMSSTRKGDNAYLYGAPYSLDRFGSGTLPVGSTNFLVKGSLPDPEMQFAYEFKKALERNGIEVSGPPQAARQMNAPIKASSYDSRKILLEYDGEKLIDVINFTNMRSVNLFAEHMLNLIGYEKTGNGSTKSGISVLDKHWQGKFNTTGMQINDGSGLSRMNAISAAHFVGLLKYMDNSTHAEAFKSSLPVAGSSGTLKYVCRGQSAQNRMAAKSGSMTRIKSYAGYIKGMSGKRYAFALIVNNYTCSSSALRKKMELVFNKIAVN